MDLNNFRHATGKCVGSSLFILFTSEMFQLVENRLFAYAADTTLLAVVHKLADRPAVAASLSRDLARIQEWCCRIEITKVDRFVAFNLKQKKVILIKYNKYNKLTLLTKQHVTLPTSINDITLLYS